MSSKLGLRLREAIHIGRSAGASDVHFVGDGAPLIRVDGSISSTLCGSVTIEELREIVRSLLNDAGRERFERLGDVSFGICDEDLGALRLHAYNTSRGASLAIRLLPGDVRTLEALGLPMAVAEFAEAPSGLVLLTGPTGSGKTTSLAALVERINRTRACHIITIEDPIEYRYAARRSIVVQREVGCDVPSFDDGLLSALRSDPDVIVLGELRASSTLQVALRAAETGHLVLATMHTSDATRAVARMIEAFPSDRQAAVRSELADVIVGVLCQRLVPRIGGGRLCAAEVLCATDAVRSVVRDGKLHHLRNVIQTGRSAGMQTLEENLQRLVIEGDVTLENARRCACRPAELSDPGRAIA
jgi:twitching motility protein PilT